METPVATISPSVTEIPASIPPPGGSSWPTPRPASQLVSELPPNPYVQTDVAPRSEPDATAAFIDSSAIVALVDRDDASHAAAVEAYRGLVASGYKLFTTNYVVAEAFDLLSTGVGPNVARRWLRENKLPVYHADERDERKARGLVIRSERRRGLSLTDAVSMVAMERLHVLDAFTLDASFLEPDAPG